MRHFAGIDFLNSDLKAKLFNSYFKQPVSYVSSSVKISDEVPRDDKETIDTVEWTAKLESAFKENARFDRQLRLRSL